MLLISLILLGFLCGAEIDLFVPSFPMLEQHFHLTPFMVELTIGVNLTAHFLTSFFVGNLGDKYGKKPVIMWSLVIFIIGSAMCAFVDSFNLILVGRALQGIGISGPNVLSYVIITQHFEKEKQAEALGLVNGIVTIAMALAPVAGSYINIYYGFKGNFAALFFLSLICFITSLLFVKEPKIEKTTQEESKMSDYLAIFKSKEQMLYLIFLCTLVLPYWTFISISPILYMDGYGVSIKHFGIFQGAVCAIFSALSLSSPLFLRKFGEENCLEKSIWIVGAFNLINLMFVLFNVNSPYLITAAMMFLSTGVLFPVNIMYPRFLNLDMKISGKLSGLFTSLRLILTAAIVQTVSYFYNGTYASTGISSFILLVVAIGSFVWIKNLDRKQQS